MADAFAGLLTKSAPAPTNPSNQFAGILTGKTATPATPVVNSSVAPAGSPTNLGANAFKGSIGSGYGASNITDSSGKPLLTYENPTALSSQLLSDRTAPTFDPTVAQPISASVLQNGRMPESVSQAIKAQFPGSTADELDHIMPLELGGSNEHSNLRLEPADNSTASYSPGTNPTNTDPLENALAKSVQSGSISLVDAWKAMASAKGVKLPEQGGAVPQLNEKGIQPNTQPNEQNNTAKITDLVALKAFPATMSTLADLQTNPLSTSASASDIFGTPQADVNKAGIAFGTAAKAVSDDFKNNAPLSQKVGDAFSALASGAGFALSPITSLFDAASKVPVLGTVSKLVFNLPFSFVGDVTGDLGSAIVNALPISAEAKQNLEPGVRAVYTLAGQIGLGGEVAPDVLGTLKETFGAKDAGTIVTEAQKLAAEKAQQEAANPKAPIVGTPTDNFGGDIIAKPEAPVDNFKGLLTKETPTIPIQDSKTVDLTKPQTPIEDIKAPDTRTPMDAIADKVNKGTPVQDILPPKTPVTVNGADFKVTQDTGAPMVKVVDLKTGNETEVPRTEIKTGTTRLLKPIEGTGEFSNFKLSKNVEASSIENGLAETLGDLPGSNKIDMADQAQKVADYINKNPDDAREVALGHKAAPKGIIPEAVFKAFTDIAREQGDGELAKDLANSELAGQARTMGVRLQALRGVNPEDPTEAIKQLQEAREKAQVKQSAIESKKLDDAVNKAKSDRQTGKVKMDWNSFVDSIKC